MLQTPAEYNRKADRPYPGERLSQYQWHTGTPVTSINKNKVLPILFRDVGPKAIATFLCQKLTRLAGSVTPICYWRSVDYQEPYTDYASIGRIVCLQPLQLYPWFSGKDYIYISQASTMPDYPTLAYVPNDRGLAWVAAQIERAKQVNEVREIFGSTDYDELKQVAIEKVQMLNQELFKSEQKAKPLRLALQSSTPLERKQAQEILSKKGLTEKDLCTAWHHLPQFRRDFIVAALGIATK